MAGLIPNGPKYVRQRGRAMPDVEVWGEAATIPTYPVGSPNRNPMFLDRRVYQGSS